jgi:multidrug/hemolysin transport system permease protein
MVQDKVSGARRDLAIAPVKSTTLSLAYFLSSASVTLIVAFAALFAGLVYIAF